jgi:hypothetical protein
MRITESQLRQIVRQEARRLMRESGDDEMARAEAHMQKHFPRFFMTRGVVARGADGNIYQVPSGSPKFSKVPFVWDSELGGFISQSAWEVKGGTFNPPPHPGGVRGPVRSPARAARRAGRFD